MLTQRRAVLQLPKEERWMSLHSIAVASGSTGRCVSGRYKTGQRQSRRWNCSRDADRSDDQTSEHLTLDALSLSLDVRYLNFFEFVLKVL